MLKILFFIYLTIGFVIYLYVKQSIDSIGIDTLLKMVANDNDPIHKVDFNKFGPQFMLLLICLFLWPLFLRQDN